MTKHVLEPSHRPGSTVRPECARADYSAPALRRFGHLRELTLRVATNPNAMSDKPGGGTNKTR